MIHHGDSLEVLKSLKASSVDSLVTDPPAGISFMGKAWDDDKGGSKQWIAWMQSVMSECLRVLKPGGHGLVWAIPRTSHWTATALEQAGFEIRDVITHVFGSGFPKSLDISKAIDKAAGAEREVVSTRKLTGKARVLKGGNFDGGYEGKELDCTYAVTAPATREAKVWQGYGTALKPASEHWILVRKPLSEKTVAMNVLKHGVGGLNIDASRILSGEDHKKNCARTFKSGIWTKSGGGKSEITTAASTQGRFPANFVLSHNEDCAEHRTTDEPLWSCSEGCAVKALDEQSGISKSPKGKVTGGGFKTGKYSGTAGIGEYTRDESNGHADSGGASRFFYCAKASKADKNEGCEGLEKKQGGTSTGATRPNRPAGLGANPHKQIEMNTNNHPTVKSTKLMTYLITMVTPSGGLVLDPFTGSGSTGVAALKAGFKFIGIEREREYVKIAQARLEAAL